MRRAIGWVGVAVILSACGNESEKKKPDPPKEANAASSSAPATSAASAPAPASQPASQPASSAAPAPASQPASSAAAVPPTSAPASAPASQPAEKAMGTHAAPPGTGGDDLIKPAVEIFRLAACGGEEKDRAGKHDAKLIARHCKELTALYDKYKKKWVDVAVPYLEALRPTDLPKVIVYPFGGGDLMSALATFPDAIEYTTISLEPPGDVRLIDGIAANKLAAELEFNRKNLDHLFIVAHSRTDNLGIESHGALPGEIVFIMSALVVYGYEPVSLRYFELADDGSIKYLTTKQLDERVKELKDKKKGQAALAEVFSSVEVVFRKAKDGKAPHKVVRHFGANLDNDHFPGSPLEKHLLAKGRVTAMTKAASHLLWSTKHFSAMRDYLLSHMEWMISDSTGIPPQYVGSAGFIQDTYGIFEGPSPFGYVEDKDTKDFKTLFKTNPKKALPFWYGYPDNAHHGHLIVTHKPGH